MEYIKEARILLDEELRAEPYDKESKDPRIRNTLRFRENIRLANSIAIKFPEPWDPAIDKEDILQESYLGLWMACLSYDDSMGTNFSTYAVPVTRGRILRSLRDNEPVKTPRSYKTIRSLLAKHKFTLPLTNEEIEVLRNEGNISLKALYQFTDITYTSFDPPIYDNDGNETSLLDIIGDPTSDIDYIVSDSEIEGTVDTIISFIKPEYRDIVEEWIYSILDGKKTSQTILAKKYKVSQAQICRILNYAISVAKMNAEEIRRLFGY